MAGEQTRSIDEGVPDMATVASLFADQAEATRALDAMAHTPFAEVKTRVIEPELDDIDGLDDLDSVVGGGFFDRVLAPFAANEYPEIDEEAREWYAQGLRRGGTVVVAVVDDDRATELERFFVEHGGRTAKND